MNTYLETLSITEAENLKKVISKLFRQTCIIQLKFDPVTLNARDNADYEICMRHKQFIENYLSVLDCELIHDPKERIFRLSGEGMECERISPVSTVIMLIIKIIYRDKILGDGLNATVTNLEEIRIYGKNCNLLNRKLTVAEWREALYLMARHQIIEVPGAVADVEERTPIYIYSTIHMYMSTAKLNALLEEYRKEDAEGETIEEDLFKAHIE